MSRSIWGLALAALAIPIVGCGSSEVANVTSHTVTGTTQQVAGATVTSYAKVDVTNTVLAVGTIIPFTLIQNPPSSPGSGPAGALAVLPFPDIVKSTTWYDHFELHWSPNGHAPARLMGVPIFDFDFYTISPQAVMQIAPPDPLPPTLDRIPEDTTNGIFYTYPGTNAVIPQEGALAIPNAELQNTQPFTNTIAVAFYNGGMISVAPTLAQSYLLQKPNLDLIRSPRPATVGRMTRAANRFSATFNASINSYQIELSDFQTVVQ
jgi:hypothetical protein